MLFRFGHIYIKSLSNLLKVRSKAGDLQDLLVYVTRLTFRVMVIEIYMHI
jgi:hypothetical protein